MDPKNKTANPSNHLSSGYLALNGQEMDISHKLYGGRRRQTWKFFKNNNSINHSRSNNIIPRPEKYDDEIENENKSNKPQGSQYCIGIMFP